MAVYVNTNYSALQGQRYLSNVNTQLTTTYQRLSSGMRINSAKDDAAGLQISDRLTSQINGLNQGNRNASDGIALAQTIESGMDEIAGMMQKVRTLAVQASNGTNTQADRDALAKEASSLVAEMQRISQQTTYGGKKILAGGDTAANGTTTIYGTAGAGGDGGSMTLQVGSNKGDTISFCVANFTFSKITAGFTAGFTKDGTKEASKGASIKFSTAAMAQDLISTMDSLIAKVDSQRSNLGAMQNRLESSIRNQSNVAANEADARSRIRDADFAEESANLTQQNIIQQAASSMLMQANTRPQLGLSLIG
ncbi:MAG: flagellin [Anaerobiospirillum succiniciproducens]|uniref:flagellin N-terminal helical domain-containing protein n=1 Tax=Anaerobiospirillum succiniciproducens TaxID=13335 RepID=UPI002A75A9DE|nr:flagellin [Anaerobiospirillum succiniciproducens]MDY2798756.1 flagellin [Anaerobiospirillum succiniciproducens]